MKITKTFTGVFLLTFLIGSVSTFLFKDSFVFTRNESPAAEKVFALILESEQTKFFLHVSAEDYLGDLFWVGDLDRDDKPDFFLSPWIKENITESSLFLPSEAEKK